jgi:glycerol uptake operon antiterminator
LSVDFLTVLRNRPVIAAIRDVASLNIPVWDRIGVLFVLGGTIFDLPRIVEQARRYEKLVFVDIDLVKGVGKDSAGVRFLARESHVDGIITTRSNLIKSVHGEGLASIERIFALDSESLAGGLSVAEKSNPDAVEILPGLIVSKIIKKIRTVISIPIIAGGLITQEEHIREILAAGAVGVSTSAGHLFRRD